MARARELAMFPLGSVLFPRALLPLHVFEQRYRALVHDSLADGHEFGVVLIERGSEVGGGDTRFAVGTLARIIQGTEFSDGRYALTALGTARLHVLEWLPERPYPRARVELVEEPPPRPDDAARRSEVERLLVGVHARRAELGEPAAPLERLQLDADPRHASFEACALAPLGPLDAQALLELGDPAARFAALEHRLADELEMLVLRLGTDGLRDADDG